ncbi:FkbM family methyltransferase [Tolypothrix sp. FACHB-123]|uniref:FkbM family methyltransferase n=1 Tax=Tolypothrix sp. FACHB-123 TaxID=2692868 RepID=UPI001682D565|nr:FkbM family methyltransferase [Tolypothrix sp. FACHB-123]MBD2357538.1 FkbM family methyltransferase [Tolypothrix sp. FACHB-123]
MMKTVSLPIPLTWIQPIDFQHKLGICERLFGKAISSEGICWVKTGSGISWKLDLANPTHRWIVYGKYEGAAFLNWAQKFLPTDAIIVDSGANIGQMLMYLAQWIPQGKILAFEPGNEAAKWLEECLTIHTSLPVEIIRAGLGASPAQLHLNNIGASIGHGAWNQISETEGEIIQIVSLADELANRSMTKVDLWKLDVEGYEIPALKGAESLLKEQRIKAIYAELIGNNGQQIRNYLAQFGYYCYLFDSHGKLYSPAQLPSHTNGLFILR